MNKVKVFRALGDETRPAMLRKLRHAGGEMPCSALVHACGTTPTAATYHYKELEQAGPITRRRGSPSGTAFLTLNGPARAIPARIRCLQLRSGTRHSFTFRVH